MSIRQIANNQYEIRTEKGTYFQSYNSVVVFRSNEGHIELGVNWDYSKTTMKFVGQFLGQNTAATRKDLKSGRFIINKNLTIK